MDDNARHQVHPTKLHYSHVATFSQMQSRGHGESHQARIII